MKFRNNKGYVGVDASIAVLILLIIVPTITGMIYNINKTNNSISRKTEAISIATNTVEALKGIELSNVEDVTNIQSKIGSIYGDVNVEVIDTQKLSIEKDRSTYKVSIDIKDYSTINNNAISGKVKIATVTVEYRVGKETQSIDLSTTLS